MNIKPVTERVLRRDQSSVADRNTFVERAIAAINPKAAGADPIVQSKMAVLVKHLHAAVDELQLKEHELHAAINFLTRACKNDDTMFLADMTGVSMRVNDITFAVPNGTAPNVIGPLYRENAPFMSNPGSLVSDDEPGDHVLISGRVTGAESGRPLAGANSRSLADRRGRKIRERGSKSARLQFSPAHPYRRRGMLPGPYGDSRCL